MNPAPTPLNVFVRLMAVIALYVLAMLALFKMVIPAGAQEEWTQKAFKSHHYGHGYSDYGRPLTRKQALKRATIEYVPVTKHVPVLKVPEHYVRLDRPKRWGWHGKHGHGGKDWSRSDHHGGDGPQCRGWERITGWPANSKKGAETYAKRMWFYTIQHQLGGQYANVDDAKDAEIICGPQAVTQWAKRVIWICEITGRPCRATEGKQIGQKEFDKDDIQVKDIEVKD